MPKHLCVLAAAVMLFNAPLLLIPGIHTNAATIMIVSQCRAPN
jgi:hypothetical protein